MAKKIVAEKNIFTKDLLITFLNSIAVIVSIFIINGIISRKFGLDAFGEFNYLRRILTALNGISILGLNIAVPYFIPRIYTKNIDSTAVHIFFTLCLPVLLLITSVIHLYFTPNILITDYLDILIYYVGIVSQVLMYAIYRGKMKMLSASVIQFTNVALIPLITVLFVKNLEVLVLIIGLINTLINMTFMIPYIIKLDYDKTNFIKLLRYGLYRIPGFIGQAALYTGITIIAVDAVSLSQLAFLTAALSVFRFVLVIIGPIGIVMLPRISGYLNNGDVERVKYQLNFLFSWSLLISLGVGFILALFGPVILNIWLGVEENLDSLAISKLFLVIPLYTVVGLLRSPIDALSEKGLNSKIYVFSATMMFIAYYTLVSTGLSAFYSCILAYFFGYLSASIISYIVCKRILKSSIMDIDLLKYSLIIVIVIFLVDKGLILFQVNNIISLFIVISSTMLCFILLIRYGNAIWVRKLRYELNKMYGKN